MDRQTVIAITKLG